MVPDSTQPVISVIIPTLDRWSELDRCLDSLRQQDATVQFEVIIVDDGSREPTPRELIEKYVDLNVTFIRQQHSGVSVARNAGLRFARSEVLAFIDSDVEVRPDYLRAVDEATTRFPNDVAFQSLLVGDSASIVHRMEHARLHAVQTVLTRPDGTISYLNTSGFSVRRSYATAFSEFFKPGVARGQDSLVLARLASEGRWPRLVPSAVAVHRPTGSLWIYLRRHWRIGFQESLSRKQLAKAEGGLMSWSARFRMLFELVRHRMECGSAAVVLVLGAYVLEMAGRTAGKLLSGACD